jgi:hypothetical protein
MVASKNKVQPVKFCAWKQEMYESVVSGGVTAQDLIQHHGHTKSTAYAYIKKIRQGWAKEQVSRVGGRPRRLDEISCAELEQQVEKLEAAKESPKDKEANKKGSMAALITEALHAQNKRRNISDDIDVSAKQARDMAKHFKSGRHNATKMTSAHWKALHDARNAVSMQVAAQAIRHLLGGDRRLLLNLDGTAFQHKGIGKDGKQTVVFCTHEHYKKIKQTGEELNTHVDDDPPDTGVFIKNLVLVNALGQVAPTVTLIDDPKVAKGATEVYPIEHFARDSISTGWIAVNNGRNGTAEFYKRYYTEILIPFVEKLRSKYALGKEKAAVLWIDGEDIQMAPLLQKELRDLLREHHIHILKGPASTTPKTQLLDTSVVFKCSHTQARQANAAKWAENETHLRLQIEQALKNHNANHLPKLKRGEKRKQTNFGAKINKLIECVLRAQYALNRNIDEANVSRGLRKTGLMDHNGNYDHKVILNNFGLTLTTEQETRFIVDCDKLFGKFLTYGSLRDAEIEATDLMQQRFQQGCDSPNLKPNEDKVIHSMRCVLITTNRFHHIQEKKKEMQVELVAKAREEKKTKQAISQQLKHDKAVKASVARELKELAKNTAQSRKPKKAKLAKSSRTVKVPNNDFEANAYEKVYGNKPSRSRQTKVN